METAEARFVTMLVERMDGQERRMEALEAELRQQREKSRLHDDLHGLSLHLVMKDGYKRFSDGWWLWWRLGHAPRMSPPDDCAAPVALDDEHRDALFAFGLRRIYHPLGTFCVGREGCRTSVGDMCEEVNAPFNTKISVDCAFGGFQQRPNGCGLFLHTISCPPCALDRWQGPPTRQP